MRRGGVWGWRDYNSIFPQQWPEELNWWSQSSYKTVFPLCFLVVYASCCPEQLHWNCLKACPAILLEKMCWSFKVEKENSILIQFWMISMLFTMTSRGNSVCRSLRITLKAWHPDYCLWHATPFSFSLSFCLFSSLSLLAFLFQKPNGESVKSAHLHRAWSGAKLFPWLWKWAELLPGLVSVNFSSY